jgi:hypothetical protein
MLNHTHRRAALLVCSIGLVCALASCGGDASTLEVDLDSIEEQDEFIERQMNVRVLVTDPNQTGTTEFEIPPASIAQALVWRCMSAPVGSGCDASDVPLNHTTSCAQRLCHSHLSLCVAHELMNLATAVGPTSFTELAVPTVVCDPLGSIACLEKAGSVAGSGDIAPQSAATRAGLAREAAKWAQHALLEAGDSLRQEAILNSGVCNNAMGTALTVSDVATSYGESFATAFSEAYALLEELAPVVESNTLAAASQFRSQFTDIGLSSRLSQVAPLLSQASLSHFLVGGPEGFKANSATPICTQPLPTLESRLAERYLRHSGVSPSSLLSSNLDTLLTGSLGVAPRLDERYGLTGNNALSGGGAARVFERTGLTRGDFAAARDRIVEDQRFADVSLSTTTLPTHPGSTTIPLHAATALPRTTSGARTDLLADIRQSVVDGAYMEGGLSWLDDRTGTVTYANSVPPGRTSMTKSIAASLDYGLSIAHELISGTFPTAPTGTTRPHDILAALRNSGLYTRPGRMETCYRFYAATHQYRVRALGTWTSSELRLVSGVDGLRCAVEGNVNGAPCSLTSYLIGGAATSAANSVRAVGFDRYVQWQFNHSDVNTTLFLVQQKPGASPDTPGGYRELTSIHAPSAATPIGTDLTWQYCSLRPITPDLDARATRSLDRSGASCTDPAQTCALLPDDQRIPLEDELIDDSDAFEDSYRYLLNLARQAADEADELGVESLRAGFDIDERAERSVDELERICGVSVNVDSLFDSALLNFVGGTCTVPAPGSADPCGAAASCVSGRCTLDPVKAALANLDSASADRLRSCLQSSAVEPLVTLGTEEVCVWHPSGVPNAVCATDGATEYADQACPYIASPGSTVTQRCPTSPPGYQVKLVSTRLGLFDSRAGASGVGEPPCAQVRQLTRTNGTTDAAERSRLLQEIRATNFFTDDNLRNLALRLRWRPDLFNYSTITLDGRPFLSTGSPSTAPTPPANPASRFPCAADAACQGATGTLYCSPIDCTSPAQRSPMNHRLARAAYAARITTGAGTSGMYIPYLPGWATGFRVDGTDVIDVISPVGPMHAIESNNVTYTANTTNTHCNRFGRLCGDTNVTHFADPAGRGYCVPNSTVTAWTDEGSTSFASNCLGTAPIFSILSAEESLGSSPAVASAYFWSGLASDSIPADLRYGSPVMYGVLSQRRGGLRANDPLASELTSFWLTYEDLVEISRDRSCTGDCREARFGRRLSRAFMPFPLVGVPDRLDREELVGASNQIEFLDRGFDFWNLSDAAELLCEAGRKAADCSLTEPPNVTDADDLASASGYMDCVANRLLRNMGRTVLSNLPSSVLASATEYATTGAYPRTGGEMSSGINEVASALVDASSAAAAIGQHIKGLASDVRRFQRQIEIAGISMERSDLQLVSEISRYQTACIAAASPSISAGAGGIGVSVNPGAALATCADSYAQIDIARQVNRLTREQLGLEEDQSFDDFRDSFENRTVALTERAGSLRAAILRIESGLAELETKRFEAHRALGRAMLADSDAMGRHYGINTFQRRRYNTARVRYEEAFLRAKQLAFLARRGVEQRLGTDLRSLDRDLQLVGRPAEWVDSLCAMTGIDYARARDGESVLTDANGEPVAHYAGEFIGDYVRRLEAVVDGYRLAYPFQNASDTAVVSLRDDVHKVRAECATPSRNILRSSNELHPSASGPWFLQNCEDSGTPSVRNCVATTPMGGADGVAPFTAYEVLFGRVDPGVTIDPLTGLMATTSLQAGSSIEQQVELEPGVYRLSWYQRDDPEWAEVVLKGFDGSEGPTELDEGGLSTPDPSWFRSWKLYEVEPTSGLGVAPYRVVIRRSSSAEPFVVGLGGFMLERIDAPDTAGATDYPPQRFAATDQAGMEVRPDCEDSSGITFQREAWRRGCDRICDTGLGGACAPTDENSACYWETTFTVTLDDLDRGRNIPTPGGFAAGNFNYRFDRVGVNVVGTELIDCAASGLPSTCYGTGNIPFSIRHEEPYLVRNHVGDTYEAPLFLGRVERARALAAERYVTNPLSSADRALVEPYMRTELRGRPLAGTYVLRIWDVDGLRFERLEDVQLVLDYRYWTRFE